MNTFDGFKVKSDSGVVLDCAAQGEWDAKPVLLIHGYSDSRQSYNPLITALAQHHRVIAVTLRGHGDSQKPESGYRISDFAADLRRVMEACSVASAAVVGHSMGSMVAARLALAQLERVHALVLLGAITTLKGSAEVEGPLQDAVAAMSDPIDPAFVREFQESTLARPVPPAFLDGVVAESVKAPARVWQGALRAMLEEDLHPEVHRIEAPTLILWGDQDGLCDRASQIRLVATMPSAELAVLAGAGHAPHWEDPGDIAARITKFLSATERAAA